MIAHTLEYLYANAQIKEIIDIIDRDCLLDVINPITPSDIVNLSINLLRIFIEIHHAPFDLNDLAISDKDKDSLKKDIKNILESDIAFVRYANNAINSQRSKNETLQDVLLAMETIDDKDLLINKILSREILK